MRSALFLAVAGLLACSRAERRSGDGGPSAACADDPGVAVQIAGANHCVVPRDVQFFGPACRHERAAPEPVLAAGKRVGFRVYSIRPGSVYAQCGFRNGDVWRTINGVDLGSDEALGAYARLGAADQLFFGLLRDGQSFRVQIDRR